jgi:ABC-2 type transport system ATP-binding protein
MSVLAFENIHRAYRRNRDVLAGVSFALEPGEVVGLVGRNGAGKTTLIRIAMGMLEAQEGSVRVFEMDPRVSPVEVKKRVGYVSEDQILPEFLRVRDVLALHREVFPSWDPDLERSLLEQFRIEPGEKIRTLSKGQARQVALLCAVAHRPELLLLDEPAGGLDPAVRREFLETAIRLLNEAGTTILFSSHYMGDIERIAGRIVLLDEGRVLLDSDLDEVREGFTLVLVPATNGTTRERLLALPRCIGVRERGGTQHAVLRLHPDNARAVVERELGIASPACRNLPLEEMFIELVGDRR